MLEPCRKWAGALVRLSSDMDGSGSRGKGGGRQRRHARGRTGGGKCQRALDDAAREFDLEGVIAGRFCVTERAPGGFPEGVRCSRDVLENVFRGAGAPRLCGDAAERKPRLLDLA